MDKTHYYVAGITQRIIPFYAQFPKSPTTYSHSTPAYCTNPSNIHRSRSSAREAQPTHLSEHTLEPSPTSGGDDGASGCDPATPLQYHSSYHKTYHHSRPFLNLPTCRRRDTLARSNLTANPTLGPTLPPKVRQQRARNLRFLLPTL